MFCIPRRKRRQARGPGSHGGKKTGDNKWKEGGGSASAGDINRRSTSHVKKKSISNGSSGGEIGYVALSGDDFGQYHNGIIRKLAIGPPNPLCNFDGDEMQYSSLWGKDLMDWKEAEEQGKVEQGADNKYDDCKKEVNNNNRPMLIQLDDFDTLQSRDNHIAGTRSPLSIPSAAREQPSSSVSSKQAGTSGLLSEKENHQDPDREPAEWMTANQDGNGGVGVGAKEGAKTRDSPSTWTNKRKDSTSLLTFEEEEIEDGADVREHALLADAGGLESCGTRSTWTPLGIPIEFDFSKVTRSIENKTDAILDRVEDPVTGGSWKNDDGETRTEQVKEGEGEFTNVPPSHRNKKAVKTDASPSASRSGVGQEFRSVSVATSTATTETGVEILLDAATQTLPDSSEAGGALVSKGDNDRNRSQLEPQLCDLNVRFLAMAIVAQHFSLEAEAAAVKFHTFQQHPVQTPAGLNKTEKSRIPRRTEVTPKRNAIGEQKSINSDKIVSKEADGTCVEETTGGNAVIANGTAETKDCYRCRNAVATCSTFSPTSQAVEPLVAAAGCNQIRGRREEGGGSVVEMEDSWSCCCWEEAGDLEKDVNSFRVALQLRQEELRKLRQLTLSQELEIMNLTRVKETNSLLVARLEDVEAQLAMLKDEKRSLHGKCLEMENNYTQILNHANKLQFDNEQLKWCLHSVNSPSNREVVEMSLEKIQCPK